MRGSKRLVAAWVLLLGACGDNNLSTAVPPGTICNPGSDTTCQCQSGATGTKACASNGQAFADCVCPGGVDGGVVPATAHGGNDPSHPTPPTCDVPTIPSQDLPPCPTGAPILFDCSNGSPPSSFACVQANPAQPLWCCP